MGFITEIALFFLLTIALGIGLFSIVASVKETGHGFLRVIQGVVAACLLIVLIINFLSVGFKIDLFVVSIIVAFFISSIIYALPVEGKNILFWFLYLGQVITLITTGYLFMSENLLSFFYFVSSSLFIGIVTYAMILGHWYLVVPKLSERPLQICLMLTWPMLCLKLILTTFSFYQSHSFFQTFSLEGGGYMFNWIMLTMRVGWGYLAILILSIFTWKLVKIRSIQSATGILYVMVFFIFVGEMISSYLHFNYGLLI